MGFVNKIVHYEDLAKWRKHCFVKIVATNGCFDILHLGHVSYLEKARSMGDLLIVGINSDYSVKQLKGPSRPINSEMDRALVIASLESVDVVVVFSELNAANFIAKVKPAIYCKGAEYSLQNLNPEERQVLQDQASEIRFVEMSGNKSTTGLVNRIKSA